MQYPEAHQSKSLIQFAKNEGRTWKSSLRQAWETGHYPDHTDCSALQQIRNAFGPSWLSSVRLADLEKSVAMLEAFPVISPAEANSNHLVILDDDRTIGVPSCIYSKIRESGFSHGVEFGRRIERQKTAAMVSLSANAKLKPPSTRCKHLVGISGKHHGYFLVDNDTLTLDRAAYKEIAAEAEAEHVEAPYFIYCRVATYSGPGMEIIQIGANEGGC